MNKKKAILAIIMIFILGLSYFLFHPHTYAIVDQVNPTCTESGSTTYKCWCGKSYTEEAPAIGHSYTESVTTEPTCTSDGVRTFTCSVCGDSYSESIPAIEHNYIENKDNADKDHCLVYVCSNCGDSYAEKEHNFIFVESGNKKTYQCSKCDYVSFTISLFEEPQEMFAQKDCDAHKGPATDYDKVKVLKVNEKIEVIGLVTEIDGEDTYWVVYKDKDGNEVFVSGAYVDTKPISNSSSSSSNNSGTKQQPAKTKEKNNGGTTQQPAKSKEKNNGGTSGGKQKSSGNFENDFFGGSVNHDYSTSGVAGGTNCGATGINWQ